MESVAKMNDSKSKNKIKIERLVLDTKTLAVAKTMVEQLKDVVPYLDKISIKDALNFFIQIRSEPLSEEEISAFCAANLSKTKIMKLATKDIEDAEAKGIELSIENALKKYQTPSVKMNLAPKKARGRKKKTQDPNLMDQAEISSGKQSGEG